MLRRAIYIAATFALSTASTTMAQTGTPTTSPRSVRAETFRLDIKQLTADVTSNPVPLASARKTRPIDITAQQRDKRLLAAVQAQLDELTKPTVTIRVDPKSIAEFSIGQAANLKDMVSRDKQRLDTCGAPADVERELKDATFDMSIADTDAKWRRGVVSVRQAVARLRDAADMSFYDGACGLEPAERDEADVIQVNAAARDMLLKQALEKGFQPSTAREDAVSFLPALAVKTNEEAKQVGISAFDYFFSNHWRLYVRSTLTLEDQEDTGEDETAAGTGASEEAKPEDLSESVKLALLDPFGGGLNVSGGYLRKIPTRFLKGDANDVHHGFFADIRGGFKFIELPEEKLKLIDGKTTNTPFLSANAALRMILPVFKDAPGTDNPGGVEVALTGSWNRVMNAGSSELFAETNGQPALLRQSLSSVHLAMKLDLPDIASIQISGTLWSNTEFDRKFLIGIGLNRSNKRQDADANAASASGIGNEVREPAK